MTGTTPNEGFDLQALIKKDPEIWITVIVMAVAAMVVGLFLLWGATHKGGGYSLEDAERTCSEIQSRMVNSYFDYDACVDDFVHDNVP